MSENPTLMDTDAAKFWCHQCRAEIKPKLPEFACPACGNDFIEEIEEQEHPTNFRLINDQQPPQPQPQQPPQFHHPPFPQHPFEMFQQFFLGGQPPVPRPINVNVNVNAFTQPPPFMFPQFFVQTAPGGAFGGGENPFDMYVLTILFFGVSVSETILTTLQDVTANVWWNGNGGNGRATWGLCF